MTGDGEEDRRGTGDGEDPGREGGEDAGKPVWGLPSLLVFGSAEAACCLGALEDISCVGEPLGVVHEHPPSLLERLFDQFTTVFDKNRPARGLLGSCDLWHRLVV